MKTLLTILIAIAFVVTGLAPLGILIAIVWFLFSITMRGPREVVIVNRRRRPRRR